MVLKANAAASAPAAPPAPAAKPAANAVQSAGEFSLVGSRLRETLAWLEIDTSGMPADRLQALSIKGKVAATANSLQISDLAMDLDSQHAAGSGSIVFAVPLTMSTSVTLDRFDLDAYMPKPKEPSPPPAVLPTTATTAPTTAPAVAAPPPRLCPTRRCRCSASRPRSPSSCFVARR